MVHKLVRLIKAFFCHFYHMFIMPCVNFILSLIRSSTAFFFVHYDLFCAYVLLKFSEGWLMNDILLINNFLFLRPVLWLLLALRQLFSVQQILKDIMILVNVSFWFKLSGFQVIWLFTKYGLLLDVCSYICLVKRKEKFLHLVLNENT